MIIFVLVKKTGMRYLLYGLAIGCLFYASCKEKQKSESVENKEPLATYFSITAFFTDQWKGREGNPYTLLRVHKHGGKSDSGYAVLDEALWAQLRAWFDPADISDTAFLGKYVFDLFDNDVTESSHLHYEATDTSLFLQKMDIGADIVDDIVKSVYLETRKRENGALHVQKLQYLPDRLFQKQTTVVRPGEKPEEDVEEYYYRY